MSGESSQNIAGSHPVSHSLRKNPEQNRNRKRESSLEALPLLEMLFGVVQVRVLHNRTCRRQDTSHTVARCQFSR